jgi:hypothetical protein
LEETIENIAVLINEHQAISAEYRYSTHTSPQLNDIVDPIILKLTKEDDSNGMNSLGPIYPPPHP